MGGSASADKRHMGRVSMLVCLCLLTVTGCAREHEAAPVPSLAAAKAAVERAVRGRYGNWLIEDRLVCNRPSENGTRVCSVTFAPLRSRPNRELCEVYAVSLDRVRGIEIAPAEGNCYLAGGATGAILAP
jgi:hypothetical protein